jgi:NADPH:quinone reductase-like Zn-dependent oxidoreductase
MKAFGHFIGTRLRSMRGTQKSVFFIAKLAQKDMEAIAELMASGKVTPVIDRRYALDQLDEAFAYFNEGHARGKIALDLMRPEPANAAAGAPQERVTA